MIDFGFGHIVKDENNVKEVSSVQIIRKNRSSGKFEFHKYAFKRVLENNNALNYPIVVISVAGPFRTGKSFLLSLFVRYLDAEKKVSWFEGQDNKGLMQLSGFQFKKGRTRETKGIYVCDKVFVLPKENNSGQVAVVLMDTQGMFDPESSDTENSTIFALSLLLSSMQIYNLKGQIQSDALKHLHLFSRYAEYASDTHGMKAFQNLYILVRDWEHSDDLIGFSGGEKYLNEWLNSGSSDAFKLKDAFEKCFSDIKACLLPHPGKEVTKLSSGVKSVQIWEIDEQFQKHIKEFVSSFLKRGNLVVKTFNSTQLKSKGFIDLVDQYLTVYNGGGFPSVESQADALDKLFLKYKIDELKGLYYKKIKGVCRKKIGNKEELMKEFLNLVDELVGSLKHKSKEEKDKVKKVLKSDLSKHLKSLQKSLSEQLKFKRNTLRMLSENFSVRVDKQVTYYKMCMDDYCKKYVDTIEKLVEVHTRYKLRFKKDLEFDCEKVFFEDYKFSFNIKAVKNNVEINKFLIEFCQQIDDYLRVLEKVLEKEKGCYEQEITRQSKFYEKVKLSIEKNSRELIKKSKKEISDLEKLNEVLEAVTELTNEKLEEKLGCTTEHYKFSFPQKAKVQSIREKATTFIKHRSIENLKTLRKSFVKEIVKSNQLKAEAEEKYRSTYKSFKRDYNSDLCSFIEGIKYNYFYRVIRKIDFLDVIGITKTIESNEKLIILKADNLTDNYLHKYEEETNVDSFSGDDKFEFDLATALKEENKKCKEEVKKTLKHDCDDSKHSELQSFKMQQKSCTIQ